MRLATQLGQSVEDKSEQLASLSSKFESVLKQLEQSNTVKDAQAAELVQSTKERD